MSLIDEIPTDGPLSRSDVERLLALSDRRGLDALYEAARAVRLREVGSGVYLRGIVEFSNVCERNCLYCGIRAGNSKVDRYTMSEDEIVASAMWAFENGYGSVVLQSGERRSGEFVLFVERVLKRIARESGGGLGVTISLGEHSLDAYRRWFDAGAHRYLLRIETSNPALYAAIHPPESDFGSRVRCLEWLREAGYQVGTGVMIGIPGQTVADLAGDVEFFKEMDVDMIGMGPFIPHGDTPMADAAAEYDPGEHLELGLKMIAVTRLALRDVNIAASTALQALRDDGRELGLRAGANVIMPNVSDVRYRSGYQLYDNKPCLDENSEQSRNLLIDRVLAVGESIAFGEWGDSPHFARRVAGV